MSDVTPSADRADTTEPSPSLYRATFGDGDRTLVFLHGGPGYNSALFEATTALALSQQFRVIIYDRRGTGRSPAAAGVEDFTFARAIEDLDNVLAGVKQPVLLGHSFGGALALQYLNARPGFDGQVVLLNAPISYQRALSTIIKNCRAVYETNKDETNVGYLDQLNAMDSTSSQYAGFALMHGMACGLYQPSSPTDEARGLIQRASKHAAAKYFAESKTEPFLGFHGQEKYTAMDLSPLVEQHKRRVWAIYGNEDRIISAEDRTFLKGVLGSHYHEVLGAAHNVFVDQQQAFIEALDRIIGGTTVSARADH